MERILTNNNYWKNRKEGDEENGPNLYTEDVTEKKENLYRIFNEFNIVPENKILEIGSNVGRNLENLRIKGYQNLSGIEICSSAIEYGRKVYPELYETVKIYNNSAEKAIKLIKSKYDLIFTMAVLTHIEDDERNKIFEWVKTHTKKVIFMEYYMYGGNSKHILNFDNNHELYETMLEERPLTNPLNYKEHLESLGFVNIKTGRFNKELDYIYAEIPTVNAK